MKNLVIKKSNIIYWLFLIFCFFPFLNILKLPTDSQPNALLLAIIIVFLNYKFILKHFPGKLVIFLLLIIFSIFPIIYSKLGFDTLISFISYLSLILVPLATLITLTKIKGLSYNFFFFTIIVWFCVAIIQRFFYPNFLSFLLTRSIGSGFMGRGVNSLSPEPTYYGSIIVLFTMIYYLNYPNESNRKLILILLFVQLFFLSLSSTVFAVLLLSFIFYVFIKILKFQVGIKPIITFFFFVFTIYIFYLIFYDTLIETRIYKILDILISKPEIILLDESINERVNHALFPLISIYDNFGLPNGYGNFQEYIIKKSSDPSYYFFFERLNIEHYKKVMSGYGAVFFELGIFGIIIPYYLYNVFKNLLNKNIYLYIFIALNLLLFTSISLNNPLILFLFGNILYQNYTKNNSCDKNMRIN